MNRWAVHWYEGMPLSPQHFEAADRYVTRQVDEAEAWALPFPWGVRSLDLVVRNDEAVLRGCEARFKDGTKVSTDDLDAGAHLTAPLDAVFRDKKVATATVFLTLPSPSAERRSVAIETCPGEPGFDPIEVELLRPVVGLEVVVGKGRSPAGPSLALARVVRKGDGGPVLDPNYAPPALSMAAAPALTRRLDELSTVLRDRVRRLAAQLGPRPVAIDPKVADDSARVLKLLAFSAADAHLRAVTATRPLPPWGVFLELCRVAGQLAPFRPNHFIEDLPAYDHDDLYECFDAVIRLIQEALGEEEASPWEPVSFRQRPETRVMDVGVQPSWFNGAGPGVYLGVRTAELSTADCEGLLASLDIATASTREVGRIHPRKTRGIRWKKPRENPPGHVEGKGLVLLEADSSQAADVLADVLASRTLAVQFNQSEAAFQGGDLVTVSHGGRKLDLEFALYVPRRAQ